MALKWRQRSLLTPPDRRTLAALLPVLLLRRGKGLPLHVLGRVRPPSTQGDYMVPHVAGAGAIAPSGRRAGVEPLEFSGDQRQAVGACQDQGEKRADQLTISGGGGSLAHDSRRMTV